MLTGSVGTPALWFGFLGFVFVMLALDLGVFHRKSHVISVREALGWSVVWISLALVFNGIVWAMFGGEKALEFLLGYVIEKSLSVDNIFVFVVIFSALGIPLIQQHRVLFWGILTALVLRAAMIFAGTAMITRFHWVMYVFGGFLILTGIKLFFGKEEEQDPTKSSAMRIARKIIPTTDELDGDKFFTVQNGKRVATRLFLALVLVEVSDVIFAVDSIPAIFGVTTDPFIVFTSNIFAILGLRSLFFVLAGFVDKFRYLKVGLAIVLAFVGCKLVLVDVVKIPPLLSLGIIASVLILAVSASLTASKREAEEAARRGDQS
jgi:tellurite resistance protein TerC